MPVIKICGLSRSLDVDYVNEALPDYIGFVFAESKRQVSDETACRLKERLDPRMKAVGVFVNDSVEHIIALCQAGIIDLIQLHGDEDETYIRRLKELVSNPVIKSVRVQIGEDIRKAEQTCSDFLLFDTYHKGYYGGCGKAFDWNLISHIRKPFFLAGGINPANVMDAIHLVSPYGIDTSSGVEVDGVKDRGKIIEMVTKVRSVK